jgi:hypothetical protein
MKNLILTLVAVLCLGVFSFADGTDPMPFCRPTAGHPCPKPTGVTVVIAAEPVQLQVLAATPQSGPIPLCPPGDDKCICEEYPDLCGVNPHFKTQAEQLAAAPQSGPVPLCPPSDPVCICEDYPDLCPKSPNVAPKTTNVVPNQATFKTNDLEIQNFLGNGKPSAACTPGCYVLRGDKGQWVCPCPVQPN